jgi:hypothetical protein
MDERRQVEPLTDAALDREIESALAVDPSPEFLARVRGRIAQEPAPVGWWWGWKLAAAGSVAVAGVVAMLVTEDARPVNQSQRSTPAAVPAAPAPPGSAAVAAVAAVEPQGTGRRPARVPASRPSISPPVKGSPFPEVMVSNAQLDAIRYLVAEANEALRPVPAPIVTRGAESSEAIELPPIGFARVVSEPVVFEPLMLE